LSQRSAPAGCTLFDPFLLSVPWDGVEWNLNIQVEQPEMQPATADSAKPATWIIGIILSALGLAACIKQGSAAV